MRSFIGLATQIGMFVPDLAQMLSSLRPLLKKNIAWIWTHQEDKFIEFKEKLCSESVIRHLIPNYAMIELECLARQWAVKKCDVYLQGLPKFEIHTDHRPLEGLFKKD